MQEPFFLPSWPPSVENFFWYGVLLLSAGIAGELVERWTRQPRLMGWVLAGILLGPHVTGAIDMSALAGMSSVIHLAMGVLLFELGQRVDLSWLRSNPKLLGTSALESALAFALMFLVIQLFGKPPLVAAVAAAIGVSTSPAVVLAVTQDQRAQGQVTERLLLLTALNSIYAYITVNILIAPLATEYRGDLVTILGHPAYLVFGSLAFAAIMARSTLEILRLLGRREETQFLAIIAMLIVAVWISIALRLSVPLALLGFGTMMRTFDRGRHFVWLNFGRLGRIFLILLFSSTAAYLDFTFVPAGIGIGLAIVVARFVGKTAGVFALARPSGLPYRKAWFLSLGLMPKSALAIILVNQTAMLYPEFRPLMATVMMSAILILEFVAAPIMQLALIYSKEAFEEGKN